jgi:RNA polymerase sigma factor (sigma-70 family)
MLRQGSAGMTDGQLLEAFIAHRDEAAFEVLVRRHGPMVLGVCGRVLRDSHDAEDAFQATFLVLARKAASVSPREMVGNWLYGVAHTTALRAKVANAKRRLRERQVADVPEAASAPMDQRDDLQEPIDEELARLPDKYRMPIVLCDLEGRSRREVAGQLKLPEGTLSSRLTTARRMLAKRLSRRGLAVSVGSLAMVLSHRAASACVSMSLLNTTVKAATLVAASQTVTANLISPAVVFLMEGVLKTMLISKLKTLTGVLLVLGGLAFAGGLFTHQSSASPQGVSQANGGARDQPPRESKTVQVGDPTADYNALFDRVMAVVSDYFKVDYANRYDGRIESFPLVPLATGGMAGVARLRRRAMVQIASVPDGTFAIQVRVVKEKEAIEGEAKNRPRTGKGTWQPIGRDTELEAVILKRLAALQGKVGQDREPPVGRSRPPAKKSVRQYELEVTLVKVDPSGGDSGKGEKEKLIGVPRLIVREGTEGLFHSGGQLAVAGDHKAPVEFLDFGITVRVKVVGMDDGRMRVESVLETTEVDKNDETGAQVSGTITRSSAVVKLGESVHLVEKAAGPKHRHGLRVRIVKEETTVSHIRSVEKETTEKGE